MFLKQDYMLETNKDDSPLEYFWKVLLWIIDFGALKFPVIHKSPCSHHRKMIRGEGGERVGGSSWSRLQRDRQAKSS